MSDKVKLPGLAAGGFHSSGANPARVHPGLKSGALGGGVKLIIGFLSNDIAIVIKAEASLSRMFGKIDYESPILDFGYSDYYKEEMGDNLKRKFISFKDLVSLKDIYKVKVKTDRLERRLSAAGKRRVNIDPGYLDLAKLTLFSTKDYTHRIHLNRGIFAEVTLFYKDRSFNAWPWTYPDYRSKPYINIFNSIRELFTRGSD